MRRETTMVTTVTLALVLVGLLMVYSASAISPIYSSYPKRQLVLMLFGLGAMFFAARFDYHRLADRGIFRSIVLFSMLTLLLVLVPGLGKEVDGGQRWINLGLFAFQPSEFAKFALIVLLAVKLTANREHVHKFWRGFLPPMVTAAVFAGLVAAERDLGVPVMLIGVTFIMMCIAGVKMRYLVISAAPACAAVGFLISMYPHRVARLVAFLNPWDHRTSWGWQLIQSFAAFARGSVFGVGAGAGEQKLGYLPAPHTDFIFAVIGEEFGLVGTTAVIALFVAFLCAAIKIAMNAQDLFGSLLASGIVGLICMQATFIMAVNTGLLPTKGLPLPFISYGGTALVVFMGMVGVLINIGAQAREPEPQRRLIPAA